MKNLTSVIFAYAIALLLLGYFFQKELRSGLSRFFRIKAPLESFEYYQVREKINYDPECPLIVSCSLFGDAADDRIYRRYFLPLLRDGPEMVRLFPGSNIRVYADPALPGDIMRQLVEAGFEVHVMNHPSRGLSGTFWRTLALEDKAPEAEVFISDTDPVFHRDLVNKGLDARAIVEDWRRTGKKFLVIGSDVVYMPFCMNRIGMRNFVIEGMEGKINRYEGREYGEDEVFMAEELWPIIKGEGFVRYELPRDQAMLVAVVLGLVVAAVVAPYWIYRQARKK